MVTRQGWGAKIFANLWPKPHRKAAATVGGHPLDLAPPPPQQGLLAGGGGAVLGSDWLWRPDVFTRKDAAFDRHNPAQGCELAAGLVLYHDADLLDLSLRQKPQQGDMLPSFGIELDCGSFDGSFLSLSLTLPAAAARGLGLRHLIRLDLLAETAPREGAAVGLFVRLNVRHGPNVEQMVSELSLPVGAGGPVVAEFDLAYGAIAARRIEALWLDLIFDAPEAGAVLLRDLTLSRCPRAAL